MLRLLVIASLITHARPQHEGSSVVEFGTQFTLQHCTNSVQREIFPQGDAGLSLGTAMGALGTISQHSTRIEGSSSAVLVSEAPNSLAPTASILSVATYLEA